MSKSSIYAVNTTTQTIEDGEDIPLMTIVRRYGCNCTLAANGIQVSGAGYYSVNGNVTFVPIEGGTATVQICLNGIPIQGANASWDTATGTTYSIDIPAMIREFCNCSGGSLLTLRLKGIDATVTNVAMTVSKL